MWPRAGGRGGHTIPLPGQVGSRAHEREMLWALWAMQAQKDAAGRWGGGGVTRKSSGRNNSFGSAVSPPEHPGGKAAGKEICCGFTCPPLPDLPLSLFLSPLPVLIHQIRS